MNSIRVAISGLRGARKVTSRLSSSSAADIETLLKSSGNVASWYERAVASGDLRRDTHQEDAIKGLDRLRRVMFDYHDAMMRYMADEAMDDARREAEGASSSRVSASPPRMPRGMYLWGPPGSGKTMCMDALHRSFERHSLARRRVHFHAFMQEMHQRIHQFKIEGRSSKESDAISAVAREVARDARLLCFDEFQVTDVADAIILGRILRVLFAKGTVVVATSNTAPDELYASGLNRRDFIPTIELLKKYCKVRSLSGDIDHRVASSDLAGHVYFSPGSLVGHEENFRCAVARAVADEDIHQGWTPRNISTMYGRQFLIPRSNGGVCYFTFHELFGTSSDTGPAEFVAVCEHFHTVIVEGIPLLRADHTPRHNESRRFITFVDQMYDSKTRLICSAARKPFDLFQAPTDAGSTNSDHRTGAEQLTGKCFRGPIYVDPATSIGLTEAELPSVVELRAAFGRSASRLVEMSGEGYQEAWREARLGR